ncbi:MAG: nucleoside 2-deoxyribosyltransferase domain-containing protein [Methanoregulaceae archaeon]|nr:nucleoside 2-deoxyribosyltransferase domain-containing protein [Methanoregulaceae archaeon]
MNKRIYIAGPLFSQAELDFNLQVSSYLEKLGYSTYLAQRDGHLLADSVLDHEGRSRAMKKIFELDLAEIKKADILLFIFDGRVPDEGACVELGIAYAMGKDCIGLKTDSRSLMAGLDNPLILGALNNRVAGSVPELEGILSGCAVSSR